MSIVSTNAVKIVLARPSARGCRGGHGSVISCGSMSAGTDGTVDERHPVIVEAHRINRARLNKFFHFFNHGLNNHTLFANLFPPLPL